MKALLAAVLGFLTVKLLGLGVNLIAFPTLRRRTGDPGPDEVSLLVPARDEADRLPHTLPGLLAQEAHEVIVLDDESVDGTATLVRCGTDRPEVSVVSGRPQPGGWVGKTWAAHQLGELARGTVLAFCDADVLLAPGALAAALAEMRAQHADVFSVFPRQRTKTWGERLLVPFVDDALLCLLPHPLLRADVPAAATANGSLLLVTRTAYEQLGGFGSVRAEIVEDVALARRSRRLGLRLGLALGGDLVQTRMFGGYADAVRGLGRGLLGVAGGSRAALAVAVVWHLVAYSLPAVLAGRNRRWVGPLVLAAVERVLVAAKSGRASWSDVLLAPVAPVAAVPVLVQALRREQTWKGRRYR